MDLFQSLIINLVFLIFLYFFFKKNSILVDNTSFSIHKKIGNKNDSPVIIGGLYLLFLSIIYFKSITVEIKIIFLFICVIGILSDKNYITSASLRFLLQLILLFLIVYFGNLSIDDFRIDILNQILKNKILNISLTIFCLAILLNGTNFIDGLNGLAVGYYIMLLASLIFVMFSNNQIILKEYNFNFIIILFYSLIFFFVLNILGKAYMGDSGSYLIGIIIGIYLIKFYELNNLISPYYIAFLLWYPAFENLFSLVRRLTRQNKISKPDNMHLHQLIFRFLKINKYFNIKMINSISSIIILLFNIPSFIYVSINIYDTKKILIILAINVLVYCTVYSRIIFSLSNKK